MNAAKALVWVMSGLLLALLAVLVVGLSLGWHLDDPQAVSSGSAVAGFDVVTLEQPQDTVVTSITELDGRLAVSLAGGGIPPRILLIDSSSGQIVGQIAISSSQE
jgi:hypothetical protein